MTLHPARTRGLDQFARSVIRPALARFPQPDLLTALAAEPGDQVNAVRNPPQFKATAVLAMHR